MGVTFTQSRKSIYASVALDVDYSSADTYIKLLYGANCVDYFSGTHMYNRIAREDVCLALFNISVIILYSNLRIFYVFYILTHRRACVKHCRTY